MIMVKYLYFIIMREYFSKSYELVWRLQVVYEQKKSKMSQNETFSEQTDMSSSEYNSSELSDSDIIEYLSTSEDDDYQPPTPKKMKFDSKKRNESVKRGKKSQIENTPVKAEEPVSTEEKTESSSITVVPCKSLTKGMDKYTHVYNISVPKSSNKLVLNLKRRNVKTISLNCIFGEGSKVIYQVEDAIITSSN